MKKCLNLGYNDFFYCLKNYIIRKEISRILRKVFNDYRNFFWILQPNKMFDRNFLNARVGFEVERLVCQWKSEAFFDDLCGVVDNILVRSSLENNRGNFWIFNKPANLTEAVAFHEIRNDVHLQEFLSKSIQRDICCLEQNLKGRFFFLIWCQLGNVY